jgi:hypothetical protein
MVCSTSLIDQPLGLVELRYPLFAKPVAEGSSMGIHADPICRDETTLRTRVAQLQRDYRQPLLLEELLPGEEYTVGVIGNGDTREARELFLTGRGELRASPGPLERLRDA